MLTLDPVRPGLTAKGIFKTSNSEWRTIFISINYVKTSLANVWLANVSIQTTFLMWIFLSKRTRKNEQFFDKKAPFWQVFNDEEFPFKGLYKYVYSVKIFKMLTAPPMSGKIWIINKFEFIKIFPLKIYIKFKFCRP